jgi:hypothetical protein
MVTPAMSQVPHSKLIISVSYNRPLLYLMIDPPVGRDCPPLRAGRLPLSPTPHSWGWRKAPAGRGEVEEGPLTAAAVLGFFDDFLAAYAPFGTSPLEGGTRGQTRCRCVAAIELRLQYGEILFFLPFLSGIQMHGKDKWHFISRALHG